MFKNLIYITAAAIILSGCSSLRQTTASSNQPAESSSVETGKKEVKFLEDISATPSKTVVDNKTPVKKSSAQSVAMQEDIIVYSPAEVEKATQTQIKYAVLLDTEVEEVRNLKVYEYIDQWYGTRYCMGGTTKSCIDCSAFVQSFFTAIYGITLPRTARDQYKSSRRISRTELREGDLLFYNTRGGVSHVGIYLQNNKFVHAAASEGVTISDIFDPYWVKRFIGVGRVGKQVNSQ